MRNKDLANRLAECGFTETGLTSAPFPDVSVTPLSHNVSVL
jgi:hypothetical protein